jgi:hypothetical protein
MVRRVYGLYGALIFMSARLPSDSSDAGSPPVPPFASHLDVGPIGAETSELPPSVTRFERVQSRSSIDTALRTIQQGQTQLSAMADTKASIMITVCSITLTVGITRFESPILRWPLILMTTSVLASLLCAVLAVLPSLGAPRKEDGTLDVDAPWFNLFFFGHFAELPRERFEAMLAEVAADDARIYAMLARDIYGQGFVLARKKYRMLRWSYLTFFAGIFATAIGGLATLISQWM